LDPRFPGVAIPAPAAPVGEKKRLDALAAAGPAVLGRFFSPLPAMFPNETVDSRSVYLYIGTAGVRKSAFVSARSGLAARFTARWSDQATRPRHARTAMARNPRNAPTTMKTVPSGRLDTCMYGAFAVGGTDASG